MTIFTRLSRVWTLGMPLFPHVPASLPTCVAFLPACEGFFPNWVGCIPVCMRLPKKKLKVKGLQMVVISQRQWHKKPDIGTNFYFKTITSVPSFDLYFRIMKKEIGNFCRFIWVYMILILKLYMIFMLFSCDFYAK